MLDLQVIFSFTSSGPLCFVPSKRPVGESLRTPSCQQPGRTVSWAAWIKKGI